MKHQEPRCSQPYILFVVLRKLTMLNLSEQAEHHKGASSVAE